MMVIHYVSVAFYKHKLNNHFRHIGCGIHQSALSPGGEGTDFGGGSLDFRKNSRRVGRGQS